MELKVLKNEKDLLEFYLKGERHTFPNLLRTVLLKNPKVSFVSYVLDHPMNEDSRFVLRTHGITPKDALNKACTEIDSQLDDFEKCIKKALK